MSTLQEVVQLAEARFGERGAAKWLADPHPVLQCSPILLAASASGRTRLVGYLQSLDRVEQNHAAGS